MIRIFTFVLYSCLLVQSTFASGHSLELKGVLNFGNEWSFSVSDNSNDSHFWVYRSHNYGSFTFESFDSDKQILVIRNKYTDEVFEISLSQPDNSDLEVPTDPEKRQAYLDKHFTKQKLSSVNNPQLLSKRKQTVKAPTTVTTDKQSSLYFNGNYGANSIDFTNPEPEIIQNQLVESEERVTVKLHRSPFLPRLNRVQSGIEGYNTPVLPPN